MKKIKLYTVTIFLLFSCCFLYNCSVQKIGSDLSKGVASQTDTIGRNLVAGLRDELSSAATYQALQKLSRFVDSLTNALTDTLGVKANRITDTLSPKVLRWVDSLINTATGSHLRNNLDSIQGVLIGKTKRDVFEMKNSFHELLLEIMSDSTRGKIALLRDELLGPKTNMALTKLIDTAVTHIVDSAMNRIAIRLRTDIDPIFKNDASFIQRNAIWLLITLGAIAAAIIFLVWRNRQKYLRMLAIVTKQVHDIPDQGIYDQVTAKIKSDSVTAGLEPDLRTLLDKNGLINTGTWGKKS